MTATVKYLTAAETAKLIRAALKEAFPGVKFSVRSDSYSLGASINVRWTDGPTQSAVSAVTEAFRAADFDAMTDSTNYRPATVIDGQPVRFGAEFVFATRSRSAEFDARLRTIADTIVGEPLDESKRYDEVRGQYVTEWGTWQSATGYNLLHWLADNVAV